MRVDTKLAIPVATSSLARIHRRRFKVRVEGFPREQVFKADTFEAARALVDVFLEAGHSVWFWETAR